MQQLQDRQVIQIKGVNSQEFLQSLLTIDVKQIKNDGWSYFATCDLHGKVIACGYLYCYTIQEWYIIVENSVALACIQQLNKTALLSQVIISQDDSIVSYATTAPLQGTTQIPNSKYSIGICPKVKITHNTHPTQFYIDELMAKIPTVHQGNSKKFTPQMLCLDQLEINQIKALSFNKGCYIGQEVISKIYHKGLCKKTFALAKTDELTDDKKIYSADNKIIGSIIQSTYFNNEILCGCVLPASCLQENNFYLSNGNKITFLID